MVRFTTLLLCFAMIISAAAFGRKKALRSPLPIEYAANSAAQKGTSNTNPVLAEAVYDYSLGSGAQLTDSIRLTYSNGRGSAFDFDGLYYDYDNTADDPGKRLLLSSYTAFDSLRAYNPPHSSTYTTAGLRSYNTAGKVMQFFQEGDQIVNYSYDVTTGRLAGTISQRYNGSSYDTSTRHTYTYGMYGSVMRDSVFSWTGTSWMPAQVSISVNNTLAYPTQRTDNVIAGGMLTPTIRRNFTYNAANRPVSIISQIYVGNVPRNLAKDSFGYAPNNMLILHNTYSWDTATATFLLRGEEYRHLDPIFGQPDSVWMRTGNGSAGFDTTIQKLACNDAGDPIYLRSYGASGRTLSDEVRWYYRLTLNAHSLGAGALSSSQPPLFIYPNPADQLLYISGANAGTPYTICNSAGQMLQSGTLTAFCAAPVAALPSGTYIIRIAGSNAGVMQSATFIRP